MSNVISFPRKRGRPKKIREEKDFGTPELQMKRTTLDTVEALDLCLDKGYITQEQHWCGIHLRWLYTLRYGAPGVRAIDLTDISGMEIVSDDPTWREAREAEYHATQKQLTLYGGAKLLTDICIHNERPGFLAPGRKRLLANIRELQAFRDGLDVLVVHWRRSREPANQK